MATRLVRDGFPDPGALDTAVSRATLEAVAKGELGETLRIHRPGDVMAFGPRDRVMPGFPDAVRESLAAGFAPVERLAGGRAAVFHEGTIALSWARPHDAPREGIRERFEEIAAIAAGAFRALGIDARIGEVPGEYCPGEHSINASGTAKLAGFGQRIVGGAVHVGGVVVVTGADRARDALIPVYAALDLPWDPSTVGSIEREVPGVTWEEAEAALVEAFAAGRDLEPAGTPDAVLERARDLLPLHDLSAAAS